MNEIEHELCKATGVKGVIKSGAKSRQKYLQTLLDKVDAFEDDDWSALSDEAQDWVNKGLKTKEGKDIPDFEDGVEEPEEGEDEPEEGEEEVEEGEDEPEEGEEEAEKVSPKKRTSTKEKPRFATKAEVEKGKKRVADKPEKRHAIRAEQEDIEEQEGEKEVKRAAKRGVPPPAPSRKERVGNGAKKEAPAEKRRVGSPGKGGSQNAIRRLLLKDMTQDAETIMSALKKMGLNPSIYSIKQVRGDFRQVIRILKEAKWPRPSLGD